MRYLVQLDAHVEVPGDGHDLGVVALDIELLDFAVAEVFHVADEALVENGVLFEVRRCHEPDIHDDVVGGIEATEYLLEMFVGIGRRDFSQFLELIDARFMEILDGYFVIPCILY